jgi:hypothetical protein
MRERTNELPFILRVYHSSLAAMALGRVVEPFQPQELYLLLRQRRRVRQRWNPTLELLTLPMTSPIVEKEEVWVKLVWTVDPREEEAPEVGLQK